MGSKPHIIIIGAGILGCFAAMHLSRYDVRLTVLEKREDVCTGISRANTGIIYPGYDQHPGSLKASLCRKNGLCFEKLCEELDVPYRCTGLMMLSFGPKADRVLEKKLAQSILNDIPGVSIIDGVQAAEMEPALRSGISCALYSETACVVDPWELGIAAFEYARANGAEFCFGENVRNIVRSNGTPGSGDRFTIEADSHTWQADCVLCCAGFESDRLWDMVNRPRIRIVPQDADYCITDTSSGKIISHIISVEPEEYGEGLTLVPTVSGNILIGPTRRDHGVPLSNTPSEEYIANSGSRAVSPGAISDLIRKCLHLIPEFPEDCIIRTFGASRPNPYYIGDDQKDRTGSSKSINDFLILEEDGFFGLIGVKTPGITCANELGAYMSDRIVEHLPDDIKKVPRTDFRRKIIRTAQLSEDELAALIQSDYSYGDIICRCRQVSKGEVLDAIRRGASTIDGVKRRCGAGMGRCQGGYCSEKILHILADELGKDIYTITKDGTGSEFIVSSADMKA